MRTSVLLALFNTAKRTAALLMSKIACRRTEIVSDSIKATNLTPTIQNDIKAARSHLSKHSDDSSQTVVLLPLASKLSVLSDTKTGCLSTQKQCHCQDEQQDPYRPLTSSPTGQKKRPSTSEVSVTKTSKKLARYMGNSLLSALSAPKNSSDKISMKDTKAGCSYPETSNCQIKCDTCSLRSPILSPDRISDSFSEEYLRLSSLENSAIYFCRMCENSCLLDLGGMKLDDFHCGRWLGFLNMVVESHDSVAFLVDGGKPVGERVLESQRDLLEVMNGLRKRFD